MEFTKQQISALDELKRFISSNSNDDKVFILSGYAGTGKTTIIKELLDIAKNKYQNLLLMAPTGKAAKVLRERTGYKQACTIHSGIFSMNPVLIKQEDDDIATTSVKLTFPLNVKLGFNFGCLCIIDEASMVSSKPSGSDDMIFGSGIMLEDIMKFVDLNTASKVIFIGDPAQLPPVGDNVSNALNPEWFKNAGYNPKHSVLTEVVRQGMDSPILRNSLKIRLLLNEDKRNELIFEKKDEEVEGIGVEQLINTFSQNWENGDKGAVITYTNSSAYFYNTNIREKLGYSHALLNKGECLMVVQNNLSDLTAPLFNGDTVEVESIDSAKETFTIKVKKRVNDKVIEENVKLEFLDASIILEDGSRVGRKLLVNLLESNKGQLSPMENRAMYILLCMRYPDLKNNSNIGLIMTSDPYYSALRVKYGYAITCHKAQGSEYKTAYIDYTGRNGLFNDALRWMYTATTRAKTRLYGVGMPAITDMCKFDFSTNIRKLSKSPDNFYPQNANVPETPFHASEVPAAVKMKYWNVSEVLEEKGISNFSIQSYPWRESYIIDGYRYDASYNSQGLFKRFTPVAGANESILNALNSTGIITFNLNYETDSSLLKNLYQKMVAICNKYDVCITNITDVSQYCTRYFMITQAYEFGFINFWYNAKGFLTRAQASSSLGNSDEKMQAIIKDFK